MSKDEKSKPDLRVEWRERTEDGRPALCYFGSKPTAGMLAHVFETMPTLYGTTLAQELDARGYDLSTLRFSIRKRGGT